MHLSPGRVAFTVVGTAFIALFSVHFSAHSFSVENMQFEVEPRFVYEIDLTPRTDLVPLASPADWRDEVMYSILIDRFNRGSGALSPWGNPAHSNTMHGGNLRGICERLDYLSALGVTVLWITPVAENPPGPLSYHGYAPRNLLNVDPARGTMEDLRFLVNEAHRKNMRVVLDFVANHTCHAFEYDDEDSSFVPLTKPPKQIKKWVEQLVPLELNHEQHFYRRGDIGDWKDTDHAVYGDFISEPGKSYKAINSGNKATQDILIKIAQHWIRQTGIDGFRLDAVRHVTAAFWIRFNAQIRQYAATLGKHDFLLLGEVQLMDVQHVSPYLTSVYGLFNSVFDFESHHTFVDFVHGKATSRQMAECFARSETELSDKTGFFTKFIDGHDLRRFLTSSDDDQLLEIGYTYLMTTTGVPCLFYGTEQCLRDGRITSANQDLDRCRTDMFAEGRFRSARQPENCFDTESWGFTLTKRLCEIRGRFASLRRGRAVLRTKDDDTSGTFAYSRVLNSEEVLIVVNPTKTDTVVQGIPLVLKNDNEKRVLTDVLHYNFKATVEHDRLGNPFVNVCVSGQSALILTDV